MPDPLNSHAWGIGMGLPLWQPAYNAAILAESLQSFADWRTAAAIFFQNDHDPSG